MNIVLTHEQADFDALAALLAAHLLQEDAIPVLPRRINRNGKAFLTLYGEELPFVEARDLPAEPIHTIFLVDTQSLVTIKGFTNNTVVRVIDHHAVRPDLPPTWIITHDPTGACATLLVEEIQERGMPLTMIQATLLLIGIYEDTGSLSYAGTTVRDIRAAAYLIEQGASLQILAEYLNPPLSNEQREVYDRLLASAEPLLIHGRNVVVSKTDAGGMVDEISSVAHKLRDLLDPDALFLLVATPEGVRIVARSTTDSVNVAAIMAAMGGGGHERAASALVHFPETDERHDRAELLESVYEELLTHLNERIRPAVTVGQIMSRSPHLIAPNTSTQDAAQLMQRYGYEGYPVVHDGQVVGLLTRRSVDRALAHRLNLPAESLMDAGQVTVQAADSIEQLQRVMVASGWGQIPVVDPDNGQIVGIVTRTDLLKTLAAQPHPSARANLAAKLEQALPPARLALLKAVAEIAHARHHAVYIVGGFVRDLLLERPSLDFDLVVEGNAISLARALVNKFGGRVVAHSRFGTAKWHIEEACVQIAARLGEGLNPADLPESLDLIAARTEFYEHPTALPTVEHSNIKLDLHRRDFTLNTMALRLDGRHYGELHDYWGGLKDLHRGLVRVLHSLSFIDDPTRLLRAVRFEQRFEFHIENRTLQLMKEANPLLKQVSGERLRHELDLILDEPRAGDMLRRLHDLGILTAIHPDLPWDETISAQLPVTDSAENAPDWDLPATLGGIPVARALAYLVWFARLNQAQINAIGARLVLPGNLIAVLLAACQLYHDLPEMADLPASGVVERLDPLPLLAIYAVFRLTPSEALRRPLLRYATRWRAIHPLTDGNRLRAMGIPPSPIYRLVLKALRDAWLDGEVHGAAEEDTLLARLLAEQGLQYNGETHG